MAIDRSMAVRLMDAAIEQAEKGWSEGGIPIGSVLARADGTIVARGHNQRVQSGDPILHAEMDCIRNAGRRIDWSELTLVSTLSPCPMCTGTAVLYKVPRVVIGENRTFLGAEHWLAEAGAEVLVLDDPRCVELMHRLQREKPGLWAEDIGETYRHTVAFVCTANSCRSQMAEGWARAIHGERLDVFSAGVRASTLNPLAVRAMAEAGIDISGHASKIVADLPGKLDVAVTVCSGADQACPAIPGAVRRVHVPFDDPPHLAQGARTDEEAMPHYRRVRDEIRTWVERELPKLLQ